MTDSIPISKDILDEIFDETGFNPNNLSIRETNRLATLISKKGNLEFVRMEMGIPNIPTPDIAKEAEKEAKLARSKQPKKKALSETTEVQDKGKRIHGTEESGAEQQANMAEESGLSDDTLRCP